MVNDSLKNSRRASNTLKLETLEIFLCGFILVEILMNSLALLFVLLFCLAPNLVLYKYLNSLVMIIRLIVVSTVASRPNRVNWWLARPVIMPLWALAVATRL